MNYLKKFAVVASLLAPGLLLAQTTVNNASAAYLNSITTLLGRVLPLLMTVALIVFFWGLVRYLLAAGDPAKADAGKHLMIWGIVALFIMSAVWGLTGILSSTLGIDTTNQQAPNTSNLIPS